MGAGDDILNISAVPASTATVKGGEGNDTLNISAAVTDKATPTGFETINIKASGSLSLAVGAIDGAKLNTEGTGALTLTGLAAANNDLNALLNGGTNASTLNVTYAAAFTADTTFKFGSAIEKATTGELNISTTEKVTYTYTLEGMGANDSLTIKINSGATATAIDSSGALTLANGNAGITADGKITSAAGGALTIAGTDYDATKVDAAAVEAIAAALNGNSSTAVKTDNAVYHLDGVGTEGKDSYIIAIGTGGDGSGAANEGYDIIHLVGSYTIDTTTAGQATITLS